MGMQSNPDSRGLATEDERALPGRDQGAAAEGGELEGSEEYFSRHVPAGAERAPSEAGEALPLPQDMGEDG